MGIIDLPLYVANLQRARRPQFSHLAGEKGRPELMTRRQNMSQPESSKGAQIALTHCVTPAPAPAPALVHTRSRTS